MKLLAGLSVLAFASLSLCSAFASDRTLLRVEVPFSFRIPGAQLPAASYDVVARTSTSGGTQVEFRNSDSGRVVIALPLTRVDSTSSDAPARLVFRCGENSACALSEVRFGGPEPGFDFKTPKSDHAERVAVVYGHVNATR